MFPRTPDLIYIPPKLNKFKRKWSYGMSIWAKDYKLEDDDVLRKCFEKDWTCCKICKFIKNVEELQ